MEVLTTGCMWCGGSGFLRPIQGWVTLVPSAWDSDQQKLRWSTLLGYRRQSPKDLPAQCALLITSSVTLGKAGDLCQPLMYHLGNTRCNGQFSVSSWQGPVISLSPRLHLAEKLLRAW